MSKATYERGKTLTYPNIYPILTFTPIFVHRGDFVWIEKVKVAWPEHDSEFTFVRSTMHDERVDNLKAENAKLVDMLGELYWCSRQLGCDRCTSRECCGTLNRMRELGIKVG